MVQRYTLGHGGNSSIYNVTVAVGFYMDYQCTSQIWATVGNIKCNRIAKSGILVVNNTGDKMLFFI